MIKKITHLPHVPITNSLAELPSQNEVENATRRMSSGKTLGSDSITAEVNAAGGSLLTGKLSDM